MDIAPLKCRPASTRLHGVIYQKCHLYTRHRGNLKSHCKKISSHLKESCSITKFSRLMLPREINIVTKHDELLDVKACATYS
jgi:hypothetical protein